MADFAGAGVVSWLQYIGGPKPGPKMQKVDVVKKKLDEILILLNPIEDGFSKSSTLQPEHSGFFYIIIRQFLLQIIWVSMCNDSQFATENTLH